MSNKKKFILWGSKGHAKVLAELIALKGGEVCALFDNEDVASALPNVPIFKGEKEFRRWIKNYPGSTQHIWGLPAIGGARGNDRLKIQALFRKYGIQVRAICHPTAVVSTNAKLGDGTQVMALANISADAILGDACIINHRASVDHECVLGDGVHVAPGATLCGCVSVADNVFIGAGAVILPRLTVGANSIIGAGAIVTRDVPKNATFIGNPAKAV